MGKGYPILVGWKFLIWSFLAGFVVGILAPRLWDFIAGL